MKNRRNVILMLALLPLAAAAQEVTDAQWEAAMQAITEEATYRIYTLNNGQREASTPYYLTDDGHLTASAAEAGAFTFHKTTGSQLYRSPGWQLDQYFTNPAFYGGGDGEMVSYGYIRRDTGNARIDFEGQVWYKSGDTYAVRATNATTTTWGANTFWCVTENYWDNTSLPNADYSLTPQFTWRLELQHEPAPPEDPTEKDVQRLTNLPHIYINTFSGRSVNSKTDYVYARLWYVDEQDQVTFYDSLQIRGRGNSTWNLAKKPYKLKFLKKAKLLGKGYANTKKWTLLANHGDKTLIRNAVTSLMGERAGLKFNPAAKFVDLTLNDNYVGNYQLSDQVDVRPHRVNIVEQDLPLTDDSDITGGYLLEADGFREFHEYSYWDNELQAYLPPDGFTTGYSGVPVRIHYPDADDLDQRQTDYIRSHVRDFEQRLFADDFTDPVAGYRPYVDSLSLVNWYLCTEMSGNIDGCYSTYFYKEQQDNRLFWGPLWDYDIAYNNDNRTDRGGSSDTERQLMKDYSYGNVKLWLQRMWQDPWFARKVNDTYRQLIDGGMEAHLNAKIDSLTQLLEASVQLNYQRWGINTRTLRERVLYSTYDEYVADLRTYISRHFPYLREAFAELLPGGSPDDPDPEPQPEPKTPDFPADRTCYYAIANYGSSTVLAPAIDAASAADALPVAAYAYDEASEAQQWQLIPLANGYLYVVNRATGLALNDPTEGQPTATTLTGTQLNVVAGDSLDIRQQWDIVAQSDHRYNLINRFSSHGANLSGGNRADGTAILSYTSDARDATSANRLWHIHVVGNVPEPIPDGLADLAGIDYALAYDPQSGRIHFGADNLSALTFPVSIFDQVGRLVDTFRACDGASLAALPRGIYLISWTLGGRRRTVKLVR